MKGMLDKPSNSAAPKTQIRFAVIFDAYNTLISVNEKGNFEPYPDSLKTLQALNSLYSVSLLAQEFKESHDAFIEANPGAKGTSLCSLLQ